MNINKGKKRAVVFLCVCLSVMQVLFFLASRSCAIGNNGIPNADKHWGITFFIALLLFLLPHEDLEFLRHKQLPEFFTNVNVDELRIEVAFFLNYAIYLGIAGFGIAMNEAKNLIIRECARNTPILLIWLVILAQISFMRVFHSNIHFFMFSTVLLTINAIIIDVITDEVCYAVIITAGLLLALCFQIGASRRENRWLLVSSYMILLFNMFVWTKPFFIEESMGKWEVSEAGVAYLEKLPDKVSSFQELLAFPCLHPFGAMFSRGGYFAVILFCMLFFAIGVVIVCSRKMLSRRRMEVLTAIYLVNGTTLLYLFLADMGCVPCIQMSLVSPYILFLASVIMIRVYVVRDISPKMKDYIRTKKDSDDNDVILFEE